MFVSVRFYILLSRAFLAGGPNSDPETQRADSADFLAQHTSSIIHRPDCQLDGDGGGEGEPVNHNRITYSQTCRSPNPRCDVKHSEEQVIANKASILTR